MERAQIGGHVEDRNVFWLGRVHTPLCFWITAHHHRPYLQTTHRRRLIDDFEDGGSAEPEPHRNGGTVCAALRTDDVSTDEYDISVHQFNALGGNQLKRLSNELSNSDGDRALFANRLMKPSRHWQLLVAMIQAKLRYKLHRRRLVSNRLQAFTFDQCLTILRRSSRDVIAKYCKSSFD